MSRSVAVVEAQVECLGGMDDSHPGVPAGQHVVVPGGNTGFLQDALLAEFGYLLF